jgi:hypothetical protein
VNLLPLAMLNGTVIWNLYIRFCHMEPLYTLPMASSIIEIDDVMQYIVSFFFLVFEFEFLSSSTISFPELIACV